MTALALLRKHPRYLLFGFLHFFCSSVGQTYFVGLFVAGVTASHGWGDDTFAALYSGATLLAAFSLPVVGVQLDRRSVRTVSTITVLVICLGLVVLASTSNMLIFAVALYAARLGGQGILPLIGSTTIGRFFQEGRGKALALTNIGKSVAEVIVPPAVVAMMAIYGYAAVWYGAATLLLLLFLPAIWLLIRKGDLFQKAERVAAAQAEDSTSAQPASLSRGEAFRDPRLLLILPAYMLAPFVLTGMVFNQGLIAEIRTYTIAWMALGLSSYGIARSVFVLLGGPGIDRWGAERLLLFIHLPLMLGLLLFLVIDHRMAVPVFFLLCGTGMGAESVMWPALWSERYGPRNLGSIKSAIRVVMVLSTAISPILFTWGFGLSLNVTLWSVLGYGVLAISLVWWQYWRYPRKVAGVV
ncbi:MAG: MFS transporter [Saprospiraceae bacterium]